MKSFKEFLAESHPRTKFAKSFTDALMDQVKGAKRQIERVVDVIAGESVTKGNKSVWILDDSESKIQVRFLEGTKTKKNIEVTKDNFDDSVNESVKFLI